jgi:hypothetical protein
MSLTLTHLYGVSRLQSQPTYYPRVMSLIMTHMSHVSYTHTPVWSVTPSITTNLLSKDLTSGCITLIPPCCKNTRARAKRPTVPPPPPPPDLPSSTIGPMRDNPPPPTGDVRARWPLSLDAGAEDVWECVCKGGGRLSPVCVCAMAGAAAPAAPHVSHVSYNNDTHESHVSYQDTHESCLLY